MLLVLSLDKRDLVGYNIGIFALIQVVSHW